MTIRSLMLLIFYVGSNFAKEPSLDVLVSPGPLSEVHKELEIEGRCQECHTTGVGVPNDKCLVCHKEIHEDQKSFRGLHGNDSNNKNCFSCHGEHKGRNHDSTKFSWKKFDHQRAGYPLKGKHRRVSCRECHVDKRGGDKFFRPTDPHFSQTQNSCRSCHQKDDHHKFTGDFAKKECSECHNENGWKVLTSFNHKEITGFDLLGKHGQINCKKCHNPTDEAPQYKWEKLKTEGCLSCHKNYHENDLRKDFQGGECLKCHDNQSWKIKKFDHEITGFKLEEKHASLTCVKCHKDLKDKEVKIFGGLDKKCQGCHQSSHGTKIPMEKYQLDCLTCHTQKSFKDEKHAKNNFQHQLTAFEITGAHEQVSCRNCHRKDQQDHMKLGPENTEPHSIYQFSKLGNSFCLNCHKTPHLNQFSDRFSEQSCDQCHGNESFGEQHRKVFDHAQTAFPLRGKHQEQTCGKCHKQSDFKIFYNGKNQVAHQFLFPELEKKGCLNCHDDYHKGEMGDKCLSCHTEDSWKNKKDFHAKFPLTGVHRNVSCRECHHDNKLISGLGNNCQFCHNKDDIHQGTLPKCEECHRQDIWQHPKFKHSLTRFPLQGAHRIISCRQCHTGGVYRGQGRDCKSCHLESAQRVVFPIHQMPQFQDCQRCHNQFKF